MAERAPALAPAFKCSVPGCKTPGADAATKDCCWPCYKRARDAKPFKCANPDCKTPGAKLAAKDRCWNCYQTTRRAGMVKRQCAPCSSGRRYHSYDKRTDKCKFCGTRRIFR